MTIIEEYVYYVAVNLYIYLDVSWVSGLIKGVLCPGPDLGLAAWQEATLQRPVQWSVVGLTSLAWTQGTLSAHGTD